MAPATIMHGGARGADSMAQHAADLAGMRTWVFPAQWGTYGSYAGFKRNIEMLDENPNLVIAFWRNRSRGTAHAIEQARLRDIPVEVYEE
jgi:hypothetical protein